MRPIGYIAPLLPEFVPAFAKSRTSAKVRPQEIIAPCVEAWVDKKFLSIAKASVRDLKWPGCQWQFSLVHGVVKDEIELEVMRELGISTIPLYQVLGGLQHLPGTITGGAGTDLAELIEYYNAKNR